MRQVHDEQKRKRPVRYTTVLKLLQNLRDKGLVRRDDRHRSHVFESAAEPEAIESRLVDRFVEEVFEGSASELVLRALSGQAHTPDELERIRALAERIADTESR